MSAEAANIGVIGLRVPGTLAYRHLAVRFISTACKMALDSQRQGEGESDFEAQVVSAFGEAFNNIAVHAHRGIAPTPTSIEVDWDEEKLVITITDRGRSYDPGDVAPPELAELPEHGMGLFIMKSCMDEVDYQPGPPNVLRLVKLRARVPAGEPRRRSGVHDADGSDIVVSLSDPAARRTSARSDSRMRAVVPEGGESSRRR